MNSPDLEGPASTAGGPSLADLFAVPAAAALLGLPAAWWVWSRDGWRLIATNAAGARAMGLADPATAMSRAYPAAHPFAAQIVRLASGLATDDGVRPGRLRVFGRFGSENAVAEAQRIAVGSGEAVIVRLAQTAAGDPQAVTLETLKALGLESVPLEASAQPATPQVAGEAAAEIAATAPVDHEADDGEPIRQEPPELADDPAEPVDEPVAAQAESEPVETGTIEPAPAEAETIETEVAETGTAETEPSGTAPPADAADVGQAPEQPASAPVAEAPPAADTEVAAPEASDQASEPVVPDAGQSPLADLEPALAVAAVAAPDPGRDAGLAVPVRFAWRLDGDGRFHGIDQPDLAAPDGLTLAEATARFGLDPEGVLARSVAAARPFSGVAAVWPLGTTRRLAVSLAAFPSLREGAAPSYAGFGLVVEERAPVSPAVPDMAGQDQPDDPAAGDDAPASQDLPLQPPEHEQPASDHAEEDAPVEAAEAAADAPEAPVAGEEAAEASPVIGQNAPATEPAAEGGAEPPPDAADPAEAEAEAEPAEAEAETETETEAEAEAETEAETEAEAAIAPPALVADAEPDQAPAAVATSEAAPPDVATDDPPEAVASSPAVTETIPPDPMVDGEADIARLPDGEGRPHLTVHTKPANVVALRSSAGVDVKRTTLSPGERNAFREIARALGARTEDDVPVKPQEPVPAADATDAPSDTPTASPVTSGTPASVTEPTGPAASPEPAEPTAATETTEAPDASVAPETTDLAGPDQAGPEDALAQEATPDEATAEDPAAEDPAAAELAAAEPAAEEPAAEDPAAEDPAAEDPAAEEPAAEEPAAEDPAAAETPVEETPVEDAPTDEATPDDATDAAATSPVAEEPAAEQPADGPTVQGLVDAPPAPAAAPPAFVESGTPFGPLPSAFGAISASAAPAAAAPHPSLALLDRVPLGLVVHRGNAILFANRTLLDWVGLADATALEAAGGIARLFAGDRHDPRGDSAAPVRLRSEGHETMPVEARLSRVTWEGEPAFLFAVTRLADEPAGETETLGELRGRLDEVEQILDTATDGIVLVTADGAIESMNRSAEALFGYEAGDMKGRSLTALFAPESHRSVLDYCDGLLSNGVASVLNDGRQVIGRVRQGGLIPLYMTMGRTGPAARPKLAAVFRDMSQWKKAEEDLLAAKRQAEQASSQKSDFLAKISHEIRTPLNAIIGFSEVMIEERFGPIGNERYRDYLKDIHASGGHVLSLINDLLDLSKIEAGKLELSFTSVDLNDIVQSTVAIMQPQANRERVIIRSSLHQRLPNVVADARSLRQIVLNLLSNSVKFTPAGGQIIISTALSDAGEAVMRVRDTGVGMTETELKAAMEPFRQVAITSSRAAKGTGLGLPLTKALVEANRASFGISSTPNQGTLVEVVFPPTRVLAE
ncbi:ATP-binding protein [Phreatobacter sp.]|uniref:ATP-binding protein n=1 Tax=Phreatobacter sp. TaxID=1966341 RepID=UPI003F7050A3